MKAKALFAALAFFGSLLVGLVLVYLYGATFLHQRYWHGTIARVHQTQAELMINLVREGSILQVTDGDTEKLRGIFKPLDWKMIVEIRRDGQVMFSNQHEGRKRARLIRDFSSDGASMQLYAYVPPSWNYQFFRWIKSPGQWFDQSNDFITVPFVFFFLMVLAMFYAIAWRMRSLYLSRDVLDVLRGREHEEQ